jgi:hypothetical protein
MDDPNDPVQKVEGDNVTWVEIASCGSIDEARLLCGFLEAEGIDAQIENVQSDVLPANFGMLGDIRIFVTSEDESRAQELLKEREREYNDLDDDAETIVTDSGATDVDENAEPESE